MQFKMSIAVLAVAALAGCASSGGKQSASTQPAAAGATQPSDVKVVKSRDGRFEGELVGTPKPGSKFSKLSIGMEMGEVTKLIGGPDNMSANETGKRWIPFYYGNDVTRVQTYYNGEGCLSFTGGNHFGGGGRELVRITADPTMKKCAE